MPTNLELKVKLQSLDAAKRVAESIGAQYRGELHQIDTYFNSQTGRLKLREIDGAAAELIFYQRAEEGGPRLSRFEQMPTTQPQLLKQMLSGSNGVLAVVEKTRLLFLFEGTRVHLDSVQSLGSFLEFEVPVVDSFEDASTRLDFLKRQFNIHPEDQFACSYLDLILKRRKEFAGSGLLHGGEA